MNESFEHHGLRSIRLSPIVLVIPWSNSPSALASAVAFSDGMLLSRSVDIIIGLATRNSITSSQQNGNSDFLVPPVFPKNRIHRANLVVLMYDASDQTCPSSLSATYLNLLDSRPKPTTTPLVLVVDLSGQTRCGRNTLVCALHQIGVPAMAPSSQFQDLLQIRSLREPTLMLLGESLADLPAMRRVSVPASTRPTSMASHGLHHDQKPAGPIPGRLD